MYMTVLNELQQLDTIHLDEVDFIESDKRKIIYHVGDKVYYHISTLSELEERLHRKGFISLDRPNLVNLRKIRFFNEEYGKVYFVEEPTKLSSFCTVARIKYKFVANLLKHIVANHNDKTTEYTIDKTEQKGLINLMKGFLN